MEPINWPSVFTKKTQSYDFEIGFGRGLFLQQYASKYLDRNIIGVEVRKNVAANVKRRLEALSLGNVYTVHGAAHILLEDAILDQSLDRVFVFHPDPWFKKSHHKRRVINPTMLALIEKKLRPKARLYLSTDVQLLWDEMKETMDSSGHYDFVRDDSFWIEDYLTNWQQFSKEDRRNSYYGTFEWKG